MATGVGGASPVMTRTGQMPWLRTRLPALLLPERRARRGRLQQEAEEEEEAAAVVVSVVVEAEWQRTSMR